MITLKTIERVSKSKENNANRRFTEGVMLMAREYPSRTRSVSMSSQQKIHKILEEKWESSYIAENIRLYVSVTNRKGGETDFRVSR